MERFPSVRQAIRSRNLTTGFACRPITYHLGVDGLSLFLVLLTTFLTPISMLASWSSINHRVKEFFIMLLLLEVGVVGVFLSLDLFLFFLFWEVMLIPMAFLIGIWGHERRIYAALKFVIYTMAGSILMLVGIVWLYHATGTFDLPRHPGNACHRRSATRRSARRNAAVPAFFVAFAIKVPLFPLHTWLPDAHVEAPTAGSVMLAGVLLKMGTYGMMRFCLPLFPDAAHRAAPYIAVLAIIGIIYGALVAMVQPNLKKLVAYSSVSHLGFVVLGIFAFTIFPCRARCTRCWRTAFPPARCSCLSACFTTASTPLKSANTAAWPLRCRSWRRSFCSPRFLRWACPCSMDLSANF